MAGEGSKKQKTRCPKCGKSHVGKFLKGMGKCYTYGLEGHNRIHYHVFIYFCQQHKGIIESSRFRAEELPCSKCGCRHKGDKEGREDIFYMCGQHGHYCRDCPRKNGDICYRRLEGLLLRMEGRREGNKRKSRRRRKK